MQAIKVVMKSTKAADYNPQPHFNPCLELATISKVPHKFIIQEFFAKFPTTRLSKEILEALRRKDSSFPIKWLQRATLLQKSSFFGPTEKSTWIQLFTARCNKFGFDMDSLMYTEALEVDWQRSGLFLLTPQLPADIDPPQHIYTHIQFLGRPFAISGDITIRGTWKIQNNWDFLLAVAFDPDQPNRREPCHLVIKQYVALEDIVPEMVKPLPEHKEPLAIADKQNEPGFASYRYRQLIFSIQ